MKQPTNLKFTNRIVNQKRKRPKTQIFCSHVDRKGVSAENLEGPFQNLNRTSGPASAEHLSHSRSARNQQHIVRLPEEITDGLQSEDGVIVKVHQHVLLSLRSCTDKRAVMKTSKGVRPPPETLRLTPSFLLTAPPLV